MQDDRIPSARMIRAARGLLGLDQAQIGELAGVDRRTVIRLEADANVSNNPRRIAVMVAIRDALEKEYGIRFVYADRNSGEGVVMERGR